MKVNDYTKKISLALWNIINFCKISYFLIKFCKKPEIFQVNIVKMTWKNCLILAEF
jgi:hypothetical protein